MGKSADPRKIVGAAYDADSQLPEQIAKNNRSIVMNIYTYTMYLNFLFEDYKTALENSIACKEFLDGGTGAYTSFIYPFVDSLTRPRLVERCLPCRTWKMDEDHSRQSKNFKKWATFAPENHQHKYLWSRRNWRARAARPARRANCTMSPSRWRGRIYF
jgi:hypothetical protein